MDNSMKILLVVVAIILVGLPLAGKLAKEDSAKQQAAVTATAPETPSPAPRISAPTPQYSPPPQPAFQAPPPPPQIPQAVQAPPRMAPPPGAPGKQPPLLNAQNLANSVWQMKVDKFDVRIQLFAGGSALATAAGLPMQIPGTWSVNGDTLNISAMGKSQSVKIVGDQLMVNGAPVQRIQ